MKITEALKSLENSWSRQDVLVKIQNGEDSEKIVNDFFNMNRSEIEILTNFINTKDIFLLSKLEDLSNCEAKLIKKIKNYSLNKNNLSDNKNTKITFSFKKKAFFNLGLFLMNWSNKFVFFSLLVISAIALSKQAWA